MNTQREPTIKEIISLIEESKYCDFDDEYQFRFEINENIFAKQGEFYIRCDAQMKPDAYIVNQQFVKITTEQIAIVESLLKHREIAADFHFHFLDEEEPETFFFVFDSKSDFGNLHFRDVFKDRQIAIDYTKDCSYPKMFEGKEIAL